MGQALCPSLALFTQRCQERRLLFVGLDASGKTSIIRRLITGQSVSTEPTIGFDVTTFDVHGVAVTAWDIGRQHPMPGRNRETLWPHYCESTSDTVFVVDAADRERLQDARVELERIMRIKTSDVVGDVTMNNERHSKSSAASHSVRAPMLLVLVNKQDVAGCLSVQEVTEALAVDRLCRSVGWRWQACGCSATTGAGVSDAFRWVLNVP